MSLQNIEEPNNIELDLYYPPAVPANWSPIPSYVYPALDQLAARTLAGSGTVTSVTESTGITCTPNPITGAGTVAIATTGVTPGSYTNMNATVNAQGQITAASNGSSTSGTVTSVGTGTGLTGGPITTTGTISIASTGVTATSYTLMNATVNAQGQITTATNGAAVTSVSSGTGLTGGPITSVGTLSLANTTVTPGSYSLPSITVDAQGRLTAASGGSLNIGSSLTGDGVSTALNTLSSSSKDCTFIQQQTIAGTSTGTIAANSLVTLFGYQNKTNNVALGTGVYTCPDTGMYSLSGYMNGSGALGTGTSSLAIYMGNGSVFQVAEHEEAGNGTIANLNCSALAYASSGNTFSLRFNNGGSSNYTGNFFFSVHYLGP